jgi:predicted nucleic acid-binding protein
MNKLNIYVDTSVFGGCFDDEFSKESKAFFELVRKGNFTLYISDVVLSELEGAPQEVQDVLLSIPEKYINTVEIDEEIVVLRNEYIKSGVLTKKWIDDATHVAAATVARVDAIISWNFRHIVRLDKMKEYNQINLLNGYGILTITTPREVVGDE